jgi:lysophospholipase L1-like esterase
MTEHRDDSQMSRFERQGLLNLSAWDAIKAVGITAVLCVLLSGGSVRHAAAQMDPGIGRDLIDAVGGPTNWVAERFPFETATNELVSGLSPDDDLGAGGFDTATTVGGGGKGTASVQPVTPDAFDPTTLGEPAPPKRPLDTLLVTGDSLSTPLDSDLARKLAPEGVDVIRDPHLGTGISNSDLVDWGQLSTTQVARDHPDAVVVFIGAADGFPLPGPNGQTLQCCDADYAAAYANRVRQVMNTYRQGGAAKVYWLTVMTPRDPGAQRVERMVNASIEAAAQPWLSQIRVVDTVPIFTPGDEYRDAMPIDGRETIVRESDGIHLNDAGSELLADLVLDRIDQDFTH